MAFAEHTLILFLVTLWLSENDIYIETLKENLISLNKNEINQERRRRRRSPSEQERSASSGGAVLFFDLADLPVNTDQAALNFLGISPAQKTIVVSSARLRLRLLGKGRVVVGQRTDGGVIVLDSGIVRSDGHLELEVGHAVQGWLLDPSSNLGLEVEGEVLVGEAKLIVNSQEVSGNWQPRMKRSTPVPCTSRCCPRPMPVRLQELEGFSFIYQPEQFDAVHCKGRCPPRYHPLNDHSLLQVISCIQFPKDLLFSLHLYDGKILVADAPPILAGGRFPDQEALLLSSRLSTS